MKAVAINGSPRKDGNTYTMLNKVLNRLEQHGVETKLIQVGGTNIHGCRACWACKKMKSSKCCFVDDVFNGIVGEALEADAIILGTPSYYSDMTPELKAFIDRFGLVGSAIGALKHKIGAGVVAQRRGGGVAIQSTLHHMFLMNEMIIVGSTYWNIGFGREKGEVNLDDEAMSNMENLADNIAWTLKRICKQFNCKIKKKVGFNADLF